VRLLEACAPALLLAAKAMAPAAGAASLREATIAPAWLSAATSSAAAILDTFDTCVLPQMPPDADLPDGLWRAQQERDTLCSEGQYRYVASSAISRGGQKRAGPQQIGYTQAVMPDGSIRDFESPRFPTDIGQWSSERSGAPHVQGTGLTYADAGYLVYHGARHVLIEPRHCCISWARDNADDQWRMVLCPCEGCSEWLGGTLDELETYEARFAREELRKGRSQDDVDRQLERDRIREVYPAPVPGRGGYVGRAAIQETNAPTPAPTPAPSAAPPAPLDLPFSKLRKTASELRIEWSISDSRTVLAQQIKAAHEAGCDCEVCDAVDRM